MVILSEPEVRVLGCLLEKAFTTPDHYPLTTNALRAACNQKSSRHPVVEYSEHDVSDAMLELRQNKLARSITGSGRTVKHRHVIDEALALSDPQMAVLAVLLLRGPQTPGELKTRTERYGSIEDMGQVERVLASLAERDDPLVVCLGRGAGQSQDRWTHLMLGEPVTDGAADSPRPSSGGLRARVEALEARILALETALGIDSAGEAESA